MSETRIDVKVEQVESAPAARKHPNTCPSCGSHYRDDELEASLHVCGQCGHHFRMSAHARIGFLTDPGSFVEEAAGVRSADPLSFFDLRPYRERLAEAELNTHLGDAMVVGSVRRQKSGSRASCSSSIDEITFGSCINERIPSCIRAPPELVTSRSGVLLAIAESAARTNFSPTALPIEPPMKEKSMTDNSQG